MCFVSTAFTPHNKSGCIPIPKHLITLPMSSIPSAVPPVPPISSNQKVRRYNQNSAFPWSPYRVTSPVPLAPPCSLPTCCPESWAGGSTCCGQPGATPLLSGCPGHTCQLGTSSYSEDVKAEFFLPFPQQEH